MKRIWFPRSSPSAQQMSTSDVLLKPTNDKRQSARSLRRPTFKPNGLFGKPFCSRLVHGSELIATQSTHNCFFSPPHEKFLYTPPTHKTNPEMEVKNRPYSCCFFSNRGFTFFSLLLLHLEPHNKKLTMGKPRGKGLLLVISPT